MSSCFCASFCPILVPPLQKIKLANQCEIYNMIVFAQLSPLILEGLWENATDLFYSWHFALCVIAQAKELSETEGRASKSVCVWVCIFSSKEAPPWRQRLKPAAVTYKQWDLIWLTNNDIELVKLYSKYQRLFSLLLQDWGTKRVVTHKRKEIKTMHQ